VLDASQRAWDRVSPASTARTPPRPDEPRAGNREARIERGWLALEGAFYLLGHAKFVDDGGAPTDVPVHASDTSTPCCRASGMFVVFA
jgi:hypothetical protein